MGIDRNEWLLAAILILFFFLIGKRPGKHSLKGHWVSQDGSRLAFDGTGEVVVNCSAYEYTLLEDKLTITMPDATYLYSYEIDHDTLMLKDIHANTTQVYHRDKDKDF